MQGLAWPCTTWIIGITHDRCQKDYRMYSCTFCKVCTSVGIVPDNGTKFGSSVAGGVVEHFSLLFSSAAVLHAVTGWHTQWS